MKTISDCHDFISGRIELFSDLLEKYKNDPYYYEYMIGSIDMVLRELNHIQEVLEEQIQEHVGPVAKLMHQNEIGKENKHDAG